MILREIYLSFNLDIENLDNLEHITRYFLISLRFYEHKIKLLSDL